MRKLEIRQYYQDPLFQSRLGRDPEGITYNGHRMNTDYQKREHLDNRRRMHRQKQSRT